LYPIRCQFDMDLARAPRRAPLTARKKGSGHENELRGEVTAWVGDFSELSFNLFRGRVVTLSGKGGFSFFKGKVSSGVQAAPLSELRQGLGVRVKALVLVSYCNKIRVDRSEIIIYCRSNWSVPQILIQIIHYLGLTNSFDQVPRNIHTLPSKIVNFLLNSLNAPITFVVCATNQSYIERKWPEMIKYLELASFTGSVWISRGTWWNELVSLR
jgi:hypothetical protein